MKGSTRREKLIELLVNSDAPISGRALAQELGVSRQVIVQDISLLRAQKHEITSTNTGYILMSSQKTSRVFKVTHTDEQVEEEMKTIVDFGGIIEDVFIYHKIYGTVRADMNIHSRRDIEIFMDNLRSGKSSLLKNVTAGYHYHTVTAPTEAILDLIQRQLEEKGFLAQLQDYEPVDFWKDEN